MTVLGLLPPEPPEPFDLRGPLPTGFTVLEASAGTGKTYSLAGLVTRFVAEEGLEASQICVVSFTEAATAELRGRIRTRLAEALTHLSTGAPDSDDDVLAAVGSDPEARFQRIARLEAALADFDAATISTIHGFCSRIVATGAGIDVPLTADDSDVDEIVADRVLARYGGDGEWPAEPRHVAEAVRLRLQLPDATMFRLDRDAVPALSAAHAARADRLDEIADLVDEVTDEVRRRRRAARRRTFDTLITDARDLLTGPDRDVVRGALQARFRLVMIDEFQDTDQAQWDIFRAAFLEGADPVRVVVVGDPKQSIYRFRSAELAAYLDARSRADTVTSLDTNRRSDGPLLDGLDTLFGGYEFGDPRVAFQSVRTAPGNEKGRLVDPGRTALELRGLEGVPAAEARARARNDMVAEVVRLLEGVEIDEDDGRRALRASDIGVLVRSNADATRFVAALAAAGVPAASSSSDSVLDSPAGQQWRILLAALERPSSPARARAAALGWFVGMSATELDRLGDEGLGDLAEQLRTWAVALVDGGLARLMSLLRANGLAERVLSRPGGERDLTDLDHVQELLQAVVGGRAVGAPALLAALADLTAPTRPGEEEVLAPELLARRIDRDDDTVKVLTVHRAKGLEFPVVLCPTLWTGRPNRQGRPHAATATGRRIDTNHMAVDGTGKTSAAFKVIEEADKVERAGEDGRLLYVALTRARHRLVVWWVPPSRGNPPLADLLGHACNGPVDLAELAADSDGAITAVEVTGIPDAPPVWGRVVPAADPLAVSIADRALDDRWRIWSFSAVKAAADAEAAALDHVAPVGVVHDVPAMGGIDEPAIELAGEIDGPSVPADGGRLHPPTTLQGAPAGTAFGTLVHAVLEEVDFTAPDLLDQLRDRSDDLLAHRLLPTSGQELAPALLESLRTPLGGPMGDRPLTDLGRRDRLDELSFDLRLAPFRVDELAAAVARHLPADDLLAPWFERAATEGLAVEVDGLLTGSIDLVGRTADGRYWLADYKTNLLADGDYSATAMAETMAHHGYPLQATLYLVALHRYLRWRLRGYDPDRHLDGAAYLFLRGMHPDRVGPSTPGIVWWRPPTIAIVELDRLLATGRAA